MKEHFFRFASLSAHANAALSIGVVVTFILYYIVGGFWETVNDAISVVRSLSFIPLLLILHQVNRTLAALPSRATVIAGITAALLFAFLQGLLVLGLVRFQQTFIFVVILGVILGLAVLVDGLLARAAASLPGGLTWLMIAFGLGYVLSATGILMGGMQHPLAAPGFLASAVAGPIWTIWLGNLLLKVPMLSAAKMRFESSI